MNRSSGRRHNGFQPIRDQSTFGESPYFNLQYLIFVTNQNIIGHQGDPYLHMVRWSWERSNTDNRQ